jgi:hypothetical protein
MNMERTDEALSTRDLASPSDRTEDSPGPVSAHPQAAAQAEGDVAVATPEPDAVAPPGYAAQRATPDEHAAGRPDKVPAASGDPIAARHDEPILEPDQPATRVDGRDESATNLGAQSDADESLLPAGDAATFRKRWEEVQTRFVDEPRGAVEDADGLVATLMQRLADGFAQEREHLEAQWGRGEDISTEALRVALQRYRSFFQRLLAT